MRAVASFLILLLAWVQPAIGAPVYAVEAKEAFESRQKDLVILAGHLGSLHRLHEICSDGYRPQLYRDRMQQVVELEVPMGSTRLDMVAAFNEHYRDMSRVYLACGDAANDTFQSEALSALQVVERLYASFR